MRIGSTRVYIVASILVCVAVSLSAQTRDLERLGGRDLSPLENAEQITFCDVEIPPARRQGLNSSWGMPDGVPLSFQQTPPILRADHGGSISLSEFALLGDYPTLTFERDDESAASGIAVERWQRTGTTTISGRTVSLFDPRWSRRVWSKCLQHERHGFDRPYILWGRVVLPSTVNDRRTAGPETRPLYLRVSSSAMPGSRVRQIAPDVQYASHVVNLVLPGFGDTRVSSGTYNFDLPTAARAFFAHFSDSYDSIAFIPRRTQVAEFGGFHRNIRNEVEGIGKPLLDQSHVYGSTGRLKSVELYPQGQFATNEDSSHEIAHQWGDGFDWATLGGIDRGGWYPSSHTPLLYRGATLIGAVLKGARRVRSVDSARFDIEQTTGPLRFHPLQMYRMGLLPVDAVPDVWVFADQNQFSESGSRLPAPGSTLVGRTNRVTIGSIVAHHGPRRGPRPTTWRRATVVVSSDGLLSQREMDYWNFFAQRLEDPNRTGVKSYDLYPSFDALTDNRVDLQTDIVPRAAAPIIQPLSVDSPAFGRRDWPGVVFDAAVPSRFSTGTSTRLSGRVTDTSRNIDTVLVRLWKHNGSSDQALRYWASLDLDGFFSVNVEPAALQTRSYSIGVFLFWPGSSSQHPRAILSPAFVD